ncbi:hypothetical protein Patl1_10729 [Pistacia atlantica]|uniref:Uncharacterized protein n=1 Tax=Pistacia atlantica TaxID=434234 RepID=A0ACC1ABL5_9ROSI|nr:hypothetical protein Patl1_10729 [Pistacia atlantica]
MGSSSEFYAIESRLKYLQVCQSGNADALDVAENAEERSYCVIMMERLTGSAEGRIDHMLQDFKLIPTTLH